MKQKFKKPKFKVLKLKASEVKIIERRQVSIDKIDRLLDMLETEIEHWANRNGLDGLTGIEDTKIGFICVNAIRCELIEKQQHLENLKKMMLEGTKDNRR